MPDQPTYLDRITPAVLRRLEERKRTVSIEALEAAPRAGRRSSFAAAIAEPGLSLIAEVKRASPSKGVIRSDLEVGSLVREYQQAGARAISVLTEQDFFGGSLSDLREAVAATDLPVLQKDFILDEYQVHEADAWGASAVLLIAALLAGDRLLRLADLAASLGLDVLLEVHDSVELARSLSVPRAIIGVNNRDLRTFAFSLDTTVRLAPSVPTGRLLVGESGIGTRADVERLEAAGVDGVLVGETLLRSPDVEGTMNRLMPFATRREAR